MQDVKEQKVILTREQMHELRAAISTIQMAVALLEKASDAKQFVEMIERNAQVALSILGVDP